MKERSNEWYKSKRTSHKEQEADNFMFTQFA